MTFEELEIAGIITARPFGRWWMAIAAGVVAVLSLFCGCMSIVRIPLCYEQVSDDGEAK